MSNPFAAFSIQIGSAGVQAGLPATDPKGAVREHASSRMGLGCRPGPEHHPGYVEYQDPSVRGLHPCQEGPRLRL